MVVEKTDAACVQRVERVEKAESGGAPLAPKITSAKPSRFFVSKRQRILYKVLVFV
jgi:hypothetical protein